MGYQPENICLLGESAGGNLCLALPLSLKDHGMELPGAIALVSPAVKMPKLADLKRIADENPEDLKLLEDYETHRMYMLDYPETNPYISPY